MSRLIDENVESVAHLSFRCFLFSPENVPRLFDLIRVNDDRVKTAFYYALRETLVAENLEQAVRLGYGTYGGKRYRVITLAGDLIEPHGIWSKFY